MINEANAARSSWLRLEAPLRIEDWRDNDDLLCFDDEPDGEREFLLEEAREDLRLDGFDREWRGSRSSDESSLSEFSLV